MLIQFDIHASDSPYIERFWHARSERGNEFISIANSNWELVVTRLRGQLTLTVRGPETKATRIYCPAEGEWLGVNF